MLLQGVSNWEGTVGFELLVNEWRGEQFGHGLKTGQLKVQLKRVISSKTQILSDLIPWFDKRELIVREARLTSNFYKHL